MQNEKRKVKRESPRSEVRASGGGETPQRPASRRIWCWGSGQWIAPDWQPWGTWWASGLLAMVVALAMVQRGEAVGVTFLDVGQGDAILLQDGSAQVLIDGGPGAAVLPQLARVLPWFDRTIDVVALTHPQRDHLEGLRHVLDRYAVRLVLMPAVAYDSRLYGEWIEALKERSVPVRFAHAGQTLTAGDIHVAVVAPRFDSVAMAQRRVNNASVGVRVEMQGLRLVLTGDAEAPAERLLVAESPAGTLQAHVLKAGHHGSRTSTTPALVKAVQPDVVVISVGADNQYGHPHPSVLGRLQPRIVVRTDQAGAVSFWWRRGQWWLSCRSQMGGQSSHSCV